MVALQFYLFWDDELGCEEFFRDWSEIWAVYSEGYTQKIKPLPIPAN